MGNRLKECRIAKNIQQKVIAAELGVSVQSVNYWEKGTREPSKANMIRLSKIYDVSVEYLMGISDNPKSQNGKKLDTSVSQGIELSEEEQKIISIYRSLSERNRLRAYSYLEGAAGSQENHPADQH